MLDNLLETENLEGWQELDKVRNLIIENCCHDVLFKIVGNGSSQLLENIENFGLYLPSAQSMSSTKMTGNNLSMSHKINKLFDVIDILPLTVIGTPSLDTSADNVRFPENSDNASSEGQLIIPVALLNNMQAGNRNLVTIPNGY